MTSMRFNDLGNDILRNLPQNLDVAWALAKRESRARYADSLFNYFWIILTPAMFAVIFVVLKQKSSSMGFTIDTGPIHPGLYAFSGVILWQTWFETLTKQIQFFKSGRSFLRTQRIAPEVFYFSQLLLSLVDGGIRFLLILLAMLVFQQPLGPLWPLAPFAALAVVLSANLIGLYLAAPGSFFPDVVKALQSIALGLLLVSPIFYVIPGDSSSFLFQVNQFNPFGALLTTFRSCLFGIPFILIESSLIWLALLLIPAPLMLIFFRVVSPIIIERL